MPKSIANEHSSTAAYKRASSRLLQGHIQLAERETLFNPSSKGAQTILACFCNCRIASFWIDKRTYWGMSNGSCDTFLSRVIKAITPQLLKGNCNSPTHCCWATRPVTQRSTLFVNQSLLATASRCFFDVVFYFFGIVANGFKLLSSTNIFHDGFRRTTKEGRQVQIDWCFLIFLNGRRNDDLLLLPQRYRKEHVHVLLWFPIAQRLGGQE